MADEEGGFAPRFTSLRGQNYLPVADRVVWLHETTRTGLEEAAGYAIETEPLRIEPEAAMFRATVTVFGPGGSVIRRTTGTGTETPSDFGDYVEKAETKAVGRALAYAGFGTAAAEEESGLIVDAPRRAAGRGASAPAPAPAPHRGQAERARGGAEWGQLRYIAWLMEQHGIGEEETRRLVLRVAGKTSLHDLDAQEALAVVEAMHVQVRERAVAAAERR
ncbi:MAG: hypothetical protein ACKOWF_18940 [Chloroflexota bacterium]